ncbi:hypothetical protein [Geitlerinema sp. PCC 7407]|uniref:hypothetical protein n=1 Tax=Geitlerinema sp. PCC 7407 TaxID=1173025 RepID=UPI00031ACD0B|nr:hypothetical protein [Geitlerinema sp. PCC 7407]
MAAWVMAAAGAYLGSQTSWAWRSRACERWGAAARSACQAWVMPGAVWQGSTTGLWSGGIFGAFLAGLATSPHRRSPVSQKGDRPDASQD